MRVRKKKITVQQILVYAALCIAVFLSIFPIYWMIVASLKPVSETMAGFESLRIHHLTLENYQKVDAVVPMLNPVISPPAPRPAPYRRLRRQGRPRPDRRPCSGPA